MGALLGPVQGTVSRPPLGAEADQKIAAKLRELQTRTLDYNRELARLHRELTELRAAELSGSPVIAA